MKLMSGKSVKYEMKLDSQSRKHPTHARHVEHDQTIGPSHIVGDNSLEARIAESISRAQGVREFMRTISQAKTSLELASAHKAIPGTEVGNGQHVIPEFKRNH